MSRIVVLSTIYLDIPSANGICARNIVSQIKKLGNQVDVICYEGDVDNTVLGNTTIYTVQKMESRSKLTTIGIGKAMRRSFALLGKNIDGLLDKNLVEAYYNKLEMLNSRSPIDCVIAMYFPLESLQAIELFKQKNPDVCAIVYELDSVDDGVAKSKIQNYYNKICEKWLKKVYSNIDYTVIMKSHKQYWEEHFPQHKNKLILADIPVLTKKEHPREIKDNKIRMMYSGLIEKKYRSPSYLLNVLLEMSKTQEFEFLFFSKGDCENEIEKFACLYDGIKQMGFVKPEILEGYSQNAGFLISIGNSVSRSLPSKLIGYIATGKPIIHFSSQENDVCVEYLKDYPLCLIVNQKDSIEDSSKAMQKFIAKNMNKTIEFDSIRDIYYLNDPHYSAESICKVLTRKQY